MLSAVLSVDFTTFYGYRLAMYICILYFLYMYYRFGGRYIGKVTKPLIYLATGTGTS